MAKVCEICGGCGNVNFEDLLVTCSTCNSTRVHVYCMPEYTLEIPEAWTCDLCLPGNEILAERDDKEESLSSSTIVRHSRKLSGPRKVSTSGWKHHSKKQKPVETGKVKFLSHEEVVRLSSGAKVGSPLKTHMARTPRKTALKSVNPKFFADRVERAATSTPPRLMKPSRDVGLHRSSLSNQEALRISNELKEKTSLTSEKLHAPKKRLLDEWISEKAGETLPNMMNNFTRKSSSGPSSRPVNPEKKTPTLPAKEYVAAKPPLFFEEQPVDVLIHLREVETSNTKKTEKELVETPRALLPSTNSPFDIDAGGDSDDDAEYDHSNVPEVNLPIIPHKVDPYRTCLPAVHTIWKGGFNIVDYSTCEFLEGFQAQPPCKVHRKAYEFSTKMPPILQLKMLPRLHLWADLFQDGCPDLQDIALYFFPADNNMEREKYSQLIERMVNQSSIMSGYVDDVELLIFTSKQLNVDSQNILLSKAEYFFCGVFLKPSEVLPELRGPLTCSYPNEANMDANASDDMDIDMIGGKSVAGKEDNVKRKDSSTDCRSNEPNAIQNDSSSLLELQAKPASISREVDLSIQQRSPLKFKLEPRKDNDKSPGFMKKPKNDNVFEKIRLMGSMKHSQGHSHGLSTRDHISDFPPGFAEKNREKKRLKIESY